jgi:hypothetical protein
MERAAKTLPQPALPASLTNDAVYIFGGLNHFILDAPLSVSVAARRAGIQIFPCHGPPTARHRYGWASREIVRVEIRVLTLLSSGAAGLPHRLAQPAIAELTKPKRSFGVARRAEIRGDFASADPTCAL